MMLFSFVPPDDDAVDSLFILSATAASRCSYAEYHRLAASSARPTRPAISSYTSHSLVPYFTPQPSSRAHLSTSKHSPSAADAQLVAASVKAESSGSLMRGLIVSSVNGASSIDDSQD